MNLDNTQLEQESEQVLTDLCTTAEQLARTHPDLVRASFVTGSFVAGHWNRQRPSLNLYFIAVGDRANALRLELARSWQTQREALAEQGWELLVDCHPYTVSHRPTTEAAQRLVSLTTKVLEGDHDTNRYRLPPTIGPGWCRAFRMLNGDPADVLLLAPHPRRTGEWARTVHRALSHYRNILDHLPWALAWYERPQILVEESARYAEEAIKDALALKLTDSELSAGMHMELLADWAVAAREFLDDRFGPDAVAVADTVTDLKDLRNQDLLSVGEAEQAWLQAQQVWQWAWEQYLPIARELLPDNDFTRVDAFV